MGEAACKHNSGRNIVIKNALKGKN